MLSNLYHLICKTIFVKASWSLCSQCSWCYSDRVWINTSPFHAYIAEHKHHYPQKVVSSKFVVGKVNNSSTCIWAWHELWQWLIWQNRRVERGDLVVMDLPRMD